jgi:cytosine/uracil/thiamine/allantoin permease
MSLAVGYTMEDYWCFSAIGIMPPGKFLNNENYIHLENIYQKFGHESYYMAWTITYAIFVVYILGLFISNRPGAVIDQGIETDGTSDEKRAYRWIMLRAGLAVGLSCASLILCILGLLGFTSL